MVTFGLLVGWSTHNRNKMSIPLYGLHYVEHFPTRALFGVLTGQMFQTREFVIHCGVYAGKGDSCRYSDLLRGEDMRRD